MGLCPWALGCEVLKQAKSPPWTPASHPSHQAILQIPSSPNKLPLFFKVTLRSLHNSNLGTIFKYLLKCSQMALRKKLVVGHSLVNSQRIAKVGFSRYKHNSINSSKFHFIKNERHLYNCHLWDFTNTKQSNYAGYQKLLISQVSIFH